MNVYLIGIGGAAAAYLVDLATNQGMTVAGSDAVESNATEVLVNKGIKVNVPQHATNINPDIDEVWYSAAITESSPGFVELDKARMLSIPTLTFAEAAARFFNRATTRIAVAGTHGKSTTTAMIGWILEKEDMDPTVAVGAEVKKWLGNGRIGSPDLFVIEADEYAKRFLEYTPSHAVVTALDHDHFDTYPSENDYIAGFKQFLSSVDQTIVANQDDRLSKEVVARLKERTVWFSQAELAKYPSLKLINMGIYNKMNALAAIKLVENLGISVERAINDLVDFPGVARRFELITVLPKDVKVFDDYGHHPTEIASTLKGAREAYPNYQIILIHQPHQAGRLAHLLPETAAALKLADKVVLLPVYQVRGRERVEDVESATSDALAKLLESDGKKAILARDYDEAANEVKKMLDQKQIIITMGATDVFKVGQILARPASIL